jgi:hypothetical protein
MGKESLLFDDSACLEFTNEPLLLLQLRWDLTVTAIVCHQLSKREWEEVAVNLRKAWHKMAAHYNCDCWSGNFVVLKFYAYRRSNVNRCSTGLQTHLNDEQSFYTVAIMLYKLHIFNYFKFH